MRVLDVEDRVLVVALQGQVDVEGELGVGLAAQHEEADRVLAGPLDQVAQRHVGAGALGKLDLLAVALHAHHRVQHVVGVVLRHVGPGQLDAGPDARDRAVVVGALQIDGAAKAPLDLGEVVGDVGHEVGVAPVGGAHHPVLVVAEGGGAQPERAVLPRRSGRRRPAGPRSPRPGRRCRGSTRGSSCRSGRRTPRGRDPARGAGRRPRTGGCRRGRRVGRRR